MTINTLSQQLDFIMELDRLKAVQRKARIKPDNNRFENSAEHSWHIALTANILKDYVEEHVDINRVVLMCLLHDIVEIDAGDTFAFDETATLEQGDKEQEAADRIFSLLPEDQAKKMRTLWQEFEDAETADGRFAKAIDRILPLLQNCLNGGGSWAEHKVRKHQVIKRNEYLKGLAPRLWDYALDQIDMAVAKGWLTD